MTRIIAGRAKGRRLAVPARGTRPTSDRVREALFASIEASLLATGRSWHEVSLCDAWSGSGAIALEAWSRGAQRVLAIDSARAAVSTIEGNIATLDASGVRVERSTMSRAVAAPPPGGAFDVLIGDPPYDDDNPSVRSILEAALDNGWLVPGALVVIERRSHGAHGAHDTNRANRAGSDDGRSPFPEGIETDSERTYGDTVLWYGRATNLRGDRGDREEQPL